MVQVLWGVYGINQVKLSASRRALGGIRRYDDASVHAILVGKLGLNET